MSMPLYTSQFANVIYDMLRFRKSLGYSEKTYACELKDFDTFCANNYPMQCELTQKLTKEWGAKRPNEKINNQNIRLVALRQLGKYIKSQGFDAHVIPTDIIVKKEHFEPYLFTDEELLVFFKTIDKITASKQNPFEEYTLPVFYRIAYGCGLRPNELFNLRRYDVNIREQSLFIFNSKTKRDRIVVITQDLVDLCEKYDKILEKHYPNRYWFFHTEVRVKYRASWFKYRMKKYWKSAGLDKRLGRCPRIYDFRHNFATRILLKWFDDSSDIMTLMPYLSSYMGHVQLHSTLYYIHLLPERIRNNKAFDWNKFELLLPEVLYEEE